jgi:uncharacterized protein (TIGR02145 family)
MDDIQYRLIVDGKVIPLRRFDNVRFVTPTRNQNPALVAARLARSTRLALEQGAPPGAVVLWGDKRKLQDIRSYKDIKNTRSAFHDPAGNMFVLTNEILIAFKGSASRRDCEKLLARHPGRVVRRTEECWTFLVEDPGEDAPLMLAMQLSEEELVAYAEPNALQAATFYQQPEDEPLFGNQWTLRNTGQNGGTSGADIDAIGAWATSLGSPNVGVTVFDSGVDIGHPDLAPNVAPGWDFDNDDDDPTNDANAHGTACAGIIAAAVNDRGVTGIAPGCRIVPLRAAGFHTWEEYASMFDWARQRSRIISCSWGITSNNTLSAAIRRAVGSGVTVFCATGNGAPATAGLAYPASMGETIAIGASTNLDVRADYSQFGTGIDLVAPSSGGTLRVQTTDLRSTNGYNPAESPAGDYCDATDATGFGGTSAATPLAAGVAALMLSVNPFLSPEEIREILRYTADQIDEANGDYNDEGWSTQYGHGRVNADDAVHRAKDLAIRRLFCATSDNRLWTRPTVLQDAAWQSIGHANHVVAMAAVTARLFCATSDNRLWVRNPVLLDVGWQHIGHANQVVAMTAIDGKLFCATSDNKLWARDPILQDVAWQHIGHANKVVAMAAIDPDETHPSTGLMTDQDRNQYKTVKIGSTWWMAENLRVTHYRNGDAITNVVDPYQWVGLSSQGAYCAYDNDVGNVASYGYLYNGHAVRDPRNIAPEGWHVPTDGEWKALEMHLGMSQTDADAYNWRGTVEGSKVKSASDWDGTNESGFSALPAGARDGNGQFSGKGSSTVYWSSTHTTSGSGPNNGGFWTRKLWSGEARINRANDFERLGHSVRLVRDN